jgi:hypothetical protein
MYTSADALHDIRCQVMQPVISGRCKFRSLGVGTSACGFVFGWCRA